ncbi:MAG: outer membrane beta-barrel protein [Rickettsiales bacterium]|nr:outer membrane beta-barrel protein [Rickettsiales bacterium]
MSSNLLAIELSTGYSFIKTQGNSDSSKKKSNTIPLNGLIQFYIPLSKIIVPYAGVGYSYNIFQNTSTSFKIKKAGDLVYQAGMDLFIFNQLGINLDFKYSRIKHRISDGEERFRSKFNTLSAMIGVVLPL